jgi:hypothetical protein
MMLQKEVGCKGVDLTNSEKVDWLIRGLQVIYGQYFKLQMKHL